MLFYSCGFNFLNTKFISVCLIIIGCQSSWMVPACNTVQQVVDFYTYILNLMATYKR